MKDIEDMRIDGDEDPIVAVACVVNARRLNHRLSEAGVCPDGAKVFLVSEDQAIRMLGWDCTFSGWAEDDGRLCNLRAYKIIQTFGHYYQ